MEDENIFDYLDRKTDEWEPYAAGVSLGAGITHKARKAAAEKIAKANRKLYRT